MASKYQRPNSPFWYVKFRDAAGSIRREPTKFRVGVAVDTRACSRRVAELTLEESTHRTVRRDQHAFARWVPDFLRVTYGNSPNTLTKYEGSWTVLAKWMAERGFSSPHQLTREHATDFLVWRTAQKANGLKGKTFVCRNSALVDLTILRVVMYEALKRAYIATNPISRLRLKKDRPREKPEFSAEEIAKVREALRKRPEWMRVSFEIALYQGCRFSETCLPLDDVNLADDTITFRIKGGRRHTTRLHRALRLMFERMKADGRRMTFAMPERNATRDWSRLFRRLKMPHSFHCTRVTCITMLARSGRVNEQQAMAWIGHAHSEIHRIYQRLRARDLTSCEEAISVAGNSENPDGPPATPGHA